MSVMVGLGLLDDLSGRGAAGRSVSSTCCRITTAAAWSTTARRLGPRAAPVAQHSLRGHGGQPLVGQPHRHRGHGRARPAGPLAHLRGRRSLAAGQRPRQPDDDLEHPLRVAVLLLGEDLRDPRQVAAAALHGLDRGRQEPGRVAAGHPDPGVAGVEAEPDAVPHVATPEAARRRAFRTSARDELERLVDPGGVGAAALGDVVLAAALAADQRADRADQLVGAQRRGPAPRR